MTEAEEEKIRLMKAGEQDGDPATMLAVVFFFGSGMVFGFLLGLIF